MADQGGQPGRTLGGRYRLERELGEGGSATVWVATDTVLQREVAVKLQRASDGDERQRERFLREARLIAALRHPNVVRVLDFGAPGDDEAYMVMEWVRGRPLDERIADAGLRPIEVASVFGAILDGLIAVHDAGIIHQDLKPENILLARTTVGDIPILIDFGISRSDRSDRGSAMTTHDGIVRGTPYYMAPEQARGLPLGVTADVYAAAVVLYEMLSGELPFDGETASDVIIRVASQPAVPLASRRPDLPSALLALVERGMAKDPADRFPSAAAMREAFCEAIAAWPEVTAEGSIDAILRPVDSGVFLLDQPSGVKSHPEAPTRTLSSAEPAPPPPRRRRGLAAIGAALLVTLAGATWALSETPTDPPITATKRHLEPDVTRAAPREERAERASATSAPVDARSEPVEAPSSAAEVETGSGARASGRAGARVPRRPSEGTVAESLPEIPAEPPAPTDPELDEAEPPPAARRAPDSTPRRPRAVVREPGF